MRGTHEPPLGNRHVRRAHRLEESPRALKSRRPLVVEIFTEGPACLAIENALDEPDPAALGQREGRAIRHQGVDLNAIVQAWYRPQIQTVDRHDSRHPAWREVALRWGEEFGERPAGLPVEGAFDEPK